MHNHSSDGKVGRDPPENPVFSSTEMLPLYSFTLILVLACAVFFYRAGEFEGVSGVAWAGLSILISVVIWHWLHGGFVAVLLGQIGLFAAITLYRSRRKP